MGLSKSDLGARAAWPPSAVRGPAIPESPLRRILRLAARSLDGATPCLALLTPEGLHLVGRRGRPPEALARLIAEIPPEPQRFIGDLGAVARRCGAPGRGRFTGCAVFPLWGSDGELRGGLYVFLQPGYPRDPAGARAFEDVAGLVEACLDFIAGAATTILPGPMSSAGFQHSLRPLFENTSDIVFTQDLSGRFTAINSVAEQLLGYTREELLQMSLSDLVPPEQRDRAGQILLEQFGGGGGSQTYELQFCSREGRTVEMEVAVHLLFRHGLPAGLIGFARDITPRKSEQAARREAEERLTRLEAELEELSGYWSRLHELTQARFPTFEAFAQQCLQTGCETLRLPLAILVESAGGSTGRVRAVHPPGALETGAAPPVRLLGLCEAPAADGRGGSPPAAAIVVPVTAAGRPWGFVSFSAADGNITVTPRARRFAEFLASLIGARLAERLLEPPGAPAQAQGALARLQSLIQTVRLQKRACSVILVESNQAAGLEIHTATLERCIRNVEEQFARDPRAKHGYEFLRLGPNRWLVLLPWLGRRSDLLVLARCVESALTEAIRTSGVEASGMVHCGAAVFPQDGNTATALLRAAEADLHAARAPAPEHVFPENQAPGRLPPDEFLLVGHLRRAFEQKQFCLRFQPQIQIDGELLGFEALLAWHHPALGPIPAGEFISAVERSGLIVPLGSWVLDEACRVAAEWRRAGHDLRKIAVNVSALQFTHPGFVESVIGALQRHRLEPYVLELEVTERIAMGDPKHAAQILRRLREVGVRVAIDDFGTGYSSLSYLTRLPVDTLKIDRSFLSDDASEAAARPTIEAIVTLAHKLGLTVVAEGVEKLKQWQMLNQTGCDSVQGHLFGRPLSREAAARLLENRSRRSRS